LTDEWLNSASHHFSFVLYGGQRVAHHRFGGQEKHSEHPLCGFILKDRRKMNFPKIGTVPFRCQCHIVPLLGEP